MDANDHKAGTSSGEISMMENQNRSSDIIININETKKDQKSKLSFDSPHTLSNDSENVMFFSSPNKPPKIPQNKALTRTKSLSRSISIYSKPKSRFGEQSVQIDSKIFEENEPLIDEHDISSRNLPKVTPNTDNVSISEAEEIYERVNTRKKIKNRKVKAKVLIEWFIFLCLIGCLIASLTINRLKNSHFWGLSIWKWFVFGLVIISGMFVTEFLMRFVVLLIELNYLLKKKVLYFVYGLQKSVRIFVWLILVLVTWVLLFKEGGVTRSRATNRALDFVTWTIASLLIGSFLWVLKSLLLKILASSFHVNTFFDRIQESMLHQYIVLTLSGPAVLENEEILGKTNDNLSQFSIAKKGKKEEKSKQVIDMNKFLQMKQGKVSAWTMKMLVDMVSNSGLTTLSNVIDESVHGEENGKTNKEITNEEEAIAAAYHIFRNVATFGSKYIDELAMRRFMIKEEVEYVFPMIDVAETGQIDRKSLTEWVLKVYKGRKALAHALNDTKTAVKQLNSVVTSILAVIMIVIWLLMTGIATTKVLVFLSSQLVLAAFMFGNTCKTIFEAIIFVFVMHPFDVGDRCVIDGVEMVVEEMNILTTVFLRFDNEKIFYPNSVLATKPISNFYRSPDMGDLLEFSIDFKTPMEKIGMLKEAIKKYLEKNPQHWHPNHIVVVKEIENVNKIKMVLFFNHTMNFQDFPEKSRRRTQLVLEMKNIFEELSIRYDLLPQQVYLNDSKT